MSLDLHALLRVLMTPCCRQVGTGADGQLACYNACLRKYRDTTDWFLAAVSCAVADPGSTSRSVRAAPRASHTACVEPCCPWLLGTACAEILWRCSPRV